MRTGLRQLALSLSERAAPTFANFLPGRNGEVLAALRGLARGAGGERFIYLWGAPGSGRTHLLRAVVNEAQVGARCASYLEAPLAPDALGGLGDDCVVGLMGVERLDPPSQAALFGLYNRIREGCGALVVGGDAPPARLPVRADLATRLAWGLVYEVQPLRDEEKAEAMRMRAAERGFELSAEAQAYVLRHGRRDLPSLLGLVDLIDRHSLAAQRPVTLPLVREVLKGARDEGAIVGD